MNDTTNHRSPAHDEGGKGGDTKRESGKYEDILMDVADAYDDLINAETSPIPTLNIVRAKLVLGKYKSVWEKANQIEDQSTTAPNHQPSAHQSKQGVSSQASGPCDEKYYVGFDLAGRGDHSALVIRKGDKVITELYGYQAEAVQALLSEREQAKESKQSSISAVEALRLAQEAIYCCDCTTDAKAIITALKPYLNITEE